MKSLLLAGLLMLLTAGATQRASRTDHPVQEAASRYAGLHLPPGLVTFLETGKWDHTPRGFRVVALSFLADGCFHHSQHDPSSRDAARACIQRCEELARKTRSGHGQDGLWRTHYNLILGTLDRVQPCAHETEHRQLSQQLAQETADSPVLHGASYTHSPHRWPADQIATLASLARFDEAHGTQLTPALARRWREYILSHAVDRTTGLPWSEVTGRARGAQRPRGCALSWQARYLLEFDPPLAREWWSNYRRHFLVRHLGMAGFREWPPGHEGPEDADSGPIVLGVGAAATGLGIGAARAMGDEELARQMESTATVVEATLGAAPGLKRHAHQVLALAIRYVGAQVRPREITPGR